MGNPNAVDLVNKMNEMNYGLKGINEMNYGLKEIKMKCDQWSWQCDKRGVDIEWLCHDME